MIYEIVSSKLSFKNQFSLVLNTFGILKFIKLNFSNRNFKFTKIPLASEIIY